MLDGLCGVLSPAGRKVGVAGGAGGVGISENRP